MNIQQRLWRWRRHYFDFHLIIIESNSDIALHGKYENNIAITLFMAQFCEKVWKINWIVIICTTLSNECGGSSTHGRVGHERCTVWDEWDDSMELNKRFDANINKQTEFIHYPTMMMWWWCCWWCRWVVCKLISLLNGYRCRRLNSVIRFRCSLFYNLWMLDTECSMHYRIQFRWICGPDAAIPSVTACCCCCCRSSVKNMCCHYMVLWLHTLRPLALAFHTNEFHIDFVVVARIMRRCT